VGWGEGVRSFDVIGEHVAQDLFGQLESVFYTYPFMREANLVIVIAAVFTRTQKKYGPARLPVHPP
jgi:hypothetical protein